MCWRGCIIHIGSYCLMVSVSTESCGHSIVTKTSVNCTVTVVFSSLISFSCKLSCNIAPTGLEPITSACLMPLGFPYRGTFFRTVFYHWHYGAFAGVGKLANPSVALLWLCYGHDSRQLDSATVGRMNQYVYWLGSTNYHTSSSCFEFEAGRSLLRHTVVLGFL